MNKWPFHGSSFFSVKQTFNPSHPENATLAINVRGIFILHPTTSVPLLSIKIGEIATWTSGPRFFSIKVHDLLAGEKYTFTTSSGEEIADLLEEYIHALVEAKKAVEGSPVPKR